ncbi:outer membrane beta-barrel protein [Psychroserpens sp.]|uniref:outer membrane beta-barrel protein n=1 Tax=Psychroserpens sp. TaxID=2020870 RepID=UPI002B266F78|nr:outer membrane beta-barrel protein [Psychroserpens sp.]
MKNLLLFAAVAVFGLSNVNAQEEGEQSFGFEKGNIIVEGNLGFSSAKETGSNNSGDVYEERTSSVSFNPKAGYFINENLAIGLALSVGSSTIEQTAFGTTNSVTEDKGNAFGAGVFARYYFLDLGKRFKTYGEFGVGFGSSKNEISQTGATTLLSDTEFSGLGAGVGLGINYFITECFAINFALSDILSYNSGTEKDNLSTTGEEVKVSSFNGNLNVFNNFFQTAQFGLTYKF